MVSTRVSQCPGPPVIPPLVFFFVHIATVANSYPQIVATKDDDRLETCYEISADALQKTPSLSCGLGIKLGVRPIFFSFHPKKWLRKLGQSCVLVKFSNEVQRCNDNCV